MSGYQSLIRIALMLVTGASMPMSFESAVSQKALGPGRKYSTVQRLNAERLRSVHEDRVRFARERRPVTLENGYSDYRAILHAHAQDASHTGGTRPELLEAAKAKGVRIVMLTDHVRPERDFIDDSWRGLHDGVLFIPGAEDRGFLSYPMASIKKLELKTREQYIKEVRKKGGNIFLSHVEERFDWPTDELDGLEIYNHHTDVKDEAEFNFWLQVALTDSKRLTQLVDALRDFPEEIFGAQQDYLAEIIQKWDRDSQLHRLTGVAANDCHHNQILTVTAVDEKTVEIGFISSKPTTKLITAEQAPGVAELVKNRRPRELIARLDFDPYERSLNYVSTHILLHELSEVAVREALRSGHAYVSHDWLCDPTGFAFIAQVSPSAPATHSSNSPRGFENGRSANQGTNGTMGDEVKFTEGLQLKVATPLPCHLKLIRNGQVIKEIRSDSLEFIVSTPGVYRIEAWLEVDDEQRPWIYSNPIYVR